MAICCAREICYNNRWVPRINASNGALIEEPSNVGASTAVYLEFLTEAYKPRAYWFVVPENTRRLMLSSALIVFAVEDEDQTPQAVSALLLSILGIKVYQYYTPFVNPTDGQFSELTQGVLMAMFLAALMARVQAMDQSDEAQTKISILLIAVVSVTFVVLSAFIVKEFRNELKKDEKVARQSMSLLKATVTGTTTTTTKAPETDLPKGTPMDAEEETKGGEGSVGTTL